MEKFEKAGKNEIGPETRPEYFFDPEFKELELLILPLIEKLKENIDKAEYDMLIGDDASGRIPTLILRGIINERSGGPEIRTRFVAGGQLRSSAELKDTIRKIKPEIEKKALIVTEYISSGKSMEQLSNILKELEISFDIATLKSEFDGEKSVLQTLSDKLKDIGVSFGITDPRSRFGRDNIKIPENSEFYYGQGTHDPDVPPLIYDNSEMSGVRKDSRSESYAIPYKQYYSNMVSKKLTDEKISDGRKGIQEKINKTRKDIDLLVNKIIEKVWGDKK
jgi:hypothetical protein